MTKRRTRSEKEKSALRRSLALAAASLAATKDSLSPNPIITIESPSNTTPINPHQGEPTASKYTTIKKDLFRSSLSIVLALALELGVYYVLNSAHLARLTSGL